MAGGVGIPGDLAVIGPACGLWLARTDPALLAERLR